MCVYHQFTLLFDRKEKIDDENENEKMQKTENQFETRTDLSVEKFILEASFFFGKLEARPSARTSDFGNGDSRPVRVPAWDPEGSSSLDGLDTLKL